MSWDCNAGRPGGDRPTGRTFAIVTWLALLALLFAWPGADPVRLSAWLALAYWAAACARLLRGDEGRTARLCWTLAWLAYLLHVGLAFHHYHGWSHAAAVEHTRQRSGVGAGVWVNYAFTLLWGGDVLWWWLWPAGRRARPRWLKRLWHGALLFIVVNAAVVFVEGPGRWLGVALLAGLLLVWLHVTVYGRPRSSGGPRSSGPSPGRNPAP